MPMSCLGLFPTFQEHTDFLFSPDQRCQSTSTRDVQSTMDTTLAQDLVHV